MPWYVRILEQVWSKDGLWAVVALVLAGVMTYTYFFEIQAIKVQVGEISEGQVRACIRAGTQPVDACWTHVPK
jgi:hypothetical protein